MNLTYVRVAVTDAAEAIITLDVHHWAEWVNCLLQILEEEAMDRGIDPAEAFQGIVRHDLNGRVRRVGFHSSTPSYK
jgi:hypothetical protein